MPELLLDAQAFGHVDRDDQTRLPARQLDRVGSDLHVHQLAVRLAVPPDVGGRRGAFGEPVQPLVESRSLLGRADVEDRHAQELVARVAVPLHGGVVDGEEAQGLRIEDPHRLWAGVEEQAVPLLARAQGFHGLNAVGHVAHGGPQRPVAAILDGAGHDVDDDFGPVLAQVPRLVRNAFSRLRVVHPRAIGRGLPPEAFHR